MILWFNIFKRVFPFCFAGGKNRMLRGNFSDLPEVTKYNRWKKSEHKSYDTETQKVCFSDWCLTDSTMLIILFSRYFLFPFLYYHLHFEILAADLWTIILIFYFSIKSFIQFPKILRKFISMLKTHNNEVKINFHEFKTSDFTIH